MLPIDELSCPVLSAEEKRHYCLTRGIIPEQHCCLSMAYAIAYPTFTPHQGPNPVLIWLAYVDEYRIPVPLTGYASTRIAFCPWCGSKLPEAKNREWYDTLSAMGFDPSEDEIPAEFRDDRWWRNRTEEC